MADMLSSGPESGDPGGYRTRGHRRWTSLLAAALVAAGAAYLAVQAGGDADPPRAAPSSPSLQIRPAPNPHRLGPPARPAVYRLDGDPGVGPAGVRMLIGGQQPGVLDTGTGRLAVLAIPIARGDVAELDHAGATTTALLHNANRLGSRAFAIRPSGKAVQLGPVLDLLPLRDGGVLTEDSCGAGGTGPCMLTEYGANGAVGWKRTVPRKLDMIRDTPYGLVVGAYQGDAGRLVRLEDARSGAVYRVIGRTCAVLGADDRQVLFISAGCGSDHPLTLADLDSGSSRLLPDNPGTPAVAAFSRDGHRLAIGYAGMLTDDPSVSPQRDGYVSVIDLTRADRWQLVPRLTTGAGSTALPVWSPDGQLLLAVPTDGAGSGRIAAWKPGATRITILPVALTGFYGTPGLAAALM